MLSPFEVEEPVPSVKRMIMSRVIEKYRDMTRVRSKPTLGTGTFSIRCGTLSYHLPESKTFGQNKVELIIDF